MQLKITEKTERILLSRTEVKADVTFTGAVPSKDDVKKELASQLKVDEKLIVVKHIYSKFKSNKADVLAYCYVNEQDMKKIEQKAKKKKKKKAEAPKEAPKEEKKPKEKPAEKKEEPKKEEKKAKEEKGKPKEEKPKEKKPAEKPEKKPEAPKEGK